MSSLLATTEDLTSITLLPDRMCLSKLRCLKDTYISDLFVYNLARDNKEEVELFRINPFALNQASKIDKLNSSPKVFSSNYM